MMNGTNNRQIFADPSAFALSAAILLNLVENAGKIPIIPAIMQKMVPDNA